MVLINEGIVLVVEDIIDNLTNIIHCIKHNMIISDSLLIIKHIEYKCLSIIFNVSFIVSKHILSSSFLNTESLKKSEKIWSMYFYTKS